MLKKPKEHFFANAEPKIIIEKTKEHTIKNNTFYTGYITAKY
jgi:hypothetical protein